MTQIAELPWVGGWNKNTVDLSPAAGYKQIGFRTVGMSPGMSGWSLNWDDFTSTARYAYPLVPGNLNATNVNGSSADLSWNDLPNESNYALRYRESGGNWTTMQVSGTSYSLTGLSGGQEYEVQIAAYNNYGSSEYSKSIIFFTCPDPVAAPAPNNVNVFKFYLAQLIQWPKVTHPDLKGYNIYTNKNDGSPVTVKFVAAPKSQFIPMIPTGPGTYTYEIKTVIEVECNGSVQTIESTTGTSQSVSYVAVEPQCDFFGLYQLEFEWIGNAWFTNIYKNDGAGFYLWVTAPLAVDHLFWCSKYGGTPMLKSGTNQTDMNTILEEYYCNLDPSYCDESLMSLIENANGATSISENTSVNLKITVYPNPSNRNTTISYFLPVESDIHIHITDMSGRVISNVADERKTAGKHFQHFDLKSEGVSSGVYFVNVRINGNVQVQKLIVE